MSANVKAVSDSSFETEVIQSELPVLVDFWADWCVPCRMVGPILEEIATEYEGKIKVVKINVDESSSIPSKFSVRGIPTLMLFKNGQAVSTQVGALPKAQLVAFVDEHLK